MQQSINQSGTGANARRYRLFMDPSHSWLEVPRPEVGASGATISLLSYYDPATFADGCHTVGRGIAP
jgi:hypothetical protein